ncbi:hypothetical protein ACFQX6_55750 [Streptosporangium lutulentum]
MTNYGNQITGGTFSGATTVGDNATVNYSAGDGGEGGGADEAVSLARELRALVERHAASLEKPGRRFATRRRSPTSWPFRPRSRTATGSPTRSRASPPASDRSAPSPRRRRGSPTCSSPDLHLPGSHPGPVPRPGPG